MSVTDLKSPRTPNEQAEAEKAWSKVVAKREIAHEAVRQYRERKHLPSKGSDAAIHLADMLCNFLDAVDEYNSKYPPMVFYITGNTAPAVDAEFEDHS